MKKDSHRNNVFMDFINSYIDTINVFNTRDAGCVWFIAKYKSFPGPAMRCTYYIEKLKMDIKYYALMRHFNRINECYNALFKIIRGFKWNIQ